jgi:hypothetical protein
MQSQQITFRLRDVNKVVVASAVGTTDGNGVATAQLNVPSTAVQLEAEYAGGDLYKKASLAVAFKVEDKIAPVVSVQKRGYAGPGRRRESNADRSQRAERPEQRRLRHQE